MNDKLDVLVAMAIIAVYQQRGITLAIVEGMSYNMTADEVVSLLTQFEVMESAAKDGILPFGA